MKKAIITGAVCAILAVVCVLFALLSRVESIAMDGGTLRRTARGSSVRYDFPNGDVYLQQSAGGGMTRQFRANACTLRYSEPGSTNWTTLQNPEDITLQRTMFLDFDTGSAIVSPPMAYEEMEHSCLRSLPEKDGSLRLQKSETGWLLTVTVPEGSAQGHWYGLFSRETLVNWQSPSQQEFWLGYQMTDTYRWCSQGMYQRAPESYFPTGSDVYFRNPASYIPVKYTLTGGSRAADDLGVAMLDCVRREVNADGYIPISTQSSWLFEVFGIGHGYYDTRWSTDLAEGLYYAAEKFGIEEFSHSVQQYADFLCRHIAEHKGILPPDYAWDGRHKTTHASLNHLLAEALLLYHADRKPEADALVSSICEKDWLRPDGNLKYGLLPDGTEIGTDYPFLTYNDLYKLRQYLGAEFPIQLQQLMDSKLTWMQKNSITGYLV